MGIHHQTKHAEIVKKYKCPKWPHCKDPKHVNGLYSTIPNLRVHLHKHHNRKKGNELSGLRVEEVYWRRTSKFFTGFTGLTLNFSSFFFLFYIISSEYNKDTANSDEEYEDEDELSIADLAKLVRIFRENDENNDSDDSDLLPESGDGNISN